MIFLSVITSLSVEAQRLEVSENGRFLVTEFGDPFFWLADTAWELLHRCDREEVIHYLDVRLAQGFTVIQTVALAELDGLHTPNSYGETPLIGDDPTTPNPAYFEHVDFVIREAKKRGMYVALLPTWGDKVNLKSWGVGPVVFDPSNAYKYGRWIGDRYADRDNVIWVIGGDRNPRANSDDIEIWNQMALGIAEGAGGMDRTLMSYHPQPKQGGGSSTWFHEEAWLDFNMHQTGHCANQGTYKYIDHDYMLSPTKPVIDAEPLYEDHPNCFNARDLGHSSARDIRRIMYWNVFAGAFGQSYGCHDVWQIYTLDRKPINQPLRPWKEALDLPMADQVVHLKNLMLSRPFLDRIPDQSMIINQASEFERTVRATRDKTGTYAMVYLPEGGSADLNLSSLQSEDLTLWFYDPRTGNAYSPGAISRSDMITLTAPTSGRGHDWILVIDIPEVNRAAPGISMYD